MRRWRAARTLIKGIAYMSTSKNPYTERTGYTSAANGKTVGSVCSKEASGTKNGTQALISG